MSDGESPCRHLEWDSAFFGCRIARVTSPRLRHEDAGRVLGWAREEAVDCLYLLADADDPETQQAAQASGFLFVDVRVTFGRELPPPEERVAPGPGVRPSRPEDVQALREIARTSHRDGRFYFDPGFDREACDAFYETWIENSCKGFADAVLVADVDGRPCGYVSCHRNDDGSGQIGLIAVDSGGRGRGVGRALVAAHLAWCRSEGCSEAVVVTQGRNVSASRLYERAGYLTRKVELWYHLWSSKKGALP